MANQARSLTTREVLLDHAEFLFARRGVQGVTTREITEAAQQRNASAISYHFGSRDGLLLEVLARRGGPVDVDRGRRREKVLVATPVKLVEALAVPYVALLDSPAGRSYVRVVAQLSWRCADWQAGSDATTSRNLTRILSELQAMAQGTRAVRSERIVAMIMLMTSLTAERARRIDEHASLALNAQQFERHLVEVCVAVLGTPGRH